MGGTALDMAHAELARPTPSSPIADQAPLSVARVTKAALVLQVLIVNEGMLFADVGIVHPGMGQLHLVAKQRGWCALCGEG